MTLLSQRIRMTLRIKEDSFHRTVQCRYIQNTVESTLFSPSLYETIAQSLDRLPSHLIMENFIQSCCIIHIFIWITHVE
jgi:hypothetical protein